MARDMYLSDFRECIVFLSESSVKKAAMIQINRENKDRYRLEFVSVPDTRGRPEQPVGENGIVGAAKQRIEDYLESPNGGKSKDNDIIVAVENGIVDYGDHWSDVCMVVVRFPGNRTRIAKSAITVPISLRDMRAYHDFLEENGVDITYGKFVAEHHEEYRWKKVQHDNWMKDVHGIDRVKQIALGLSQLL